MADDPFEDILNLEDQFYQEGYSQGVKDGVKAGQIEGRILGLEKGFEKFLESGKLEGKAIVWANRFPATKHKSTESRYDSSSGVATVQAESGYTPTLPPLSSNPRLEKNITSLFALVEFESLSTENTDEAVNDFDDRFRRAQGKAKIIERAIGEDMEHKSV
jgi:hypothetical protein